MTEEIDFRPKELYAFTYGEIKVTVHGMKLHDVESTYITLDPCGALSSAQNDYFESLKHRSHLYACETVTRKIVERLKAYSLNPHLERMTGTIATEERDRNYDTWGIRFGAALMHPDKVDPAAVVAIVRGVVETQQSFVKAVAEGETAAKQEFTLRFASPGVYPPQNVAEEIVQAVKLAYGIERKLSVPEHQALLKKIDGLLAKTSNRQWNRK